MSQSWFKKNLFMLTLYLNMDDNLYKSKALKSGQGQTHFNSYRVKQNNNFKVM